MRTSYAQVLPPELCRLVEEYALPYLEYDLINFLLSCADWDKWASPRIKEGEIIQQARANEQLAALLSDKGIDLKQFPLQSILDQQPLNEEFHRRLSEIPINIDDEVKSIYFIVGTGDEKYCLTTDIRINKLHRKHGFTMGNIMGMLSSYGSRDESSYPIIDNSATTFRDGILRIYVYWYDKGEDKSLTLHARDIKKQLQA